MEQLLSSGTVDLGSWSSAYLKATTFISTLEPLGRSPWGYGRGRCTSVYASAIVKLDHLFELGEVFSDHLRQSLFHETYRSPFYNAVRACIGGTMCAMNKFNGTYSCESQDLLVRYLKVELGFPGIVHADVGAQHTGINSANAGMDFGSASDWSETTLGAGLLNGSFTQERLDDMAVRDRMGYFRYAQDEGYPELVCATDRVDVRGDHSALARQFAGESITLLKFGTHAMPRYVGARRVGTPSTTCSSAR